MKRVWWGQANAEDGNQMVRQSTKKKERIIDFKNR